MKCYFLRYELHFKSPGGTSRGVLHDKSTYIIVLTDGSKTAYGECNLFRGLSADDRSTYEEQLEAICKRIPSEMDAVLADLAHWPSIRFGIETLLRDWHNGGNRIIFPDCIGPKGFSLPTNALIWMGSRAFMETQIMQKLEEGYRSIKLKIGAIDFDTELALIKLIREHADASEVEIRVDANGAFGFREAKEKIRRLAEYDIHYIEQPVRAGQWQEMAALAADTPVRIALDEELIGISDPAEMAELLRTVAPQVLILKPALVGGFSACDTWIRLIEEAGGTWVITSALESNIGLNAIAQYTATKKPVLHQGLGTGQLFTNNFPSPYTVDSSGLHYHCDKIWDLTAIE